VSCLQCIGATTLDEYRKHIEKDPALERRFQPVLVPEPTVEETIDILKGLRERYEIHHKLRYTDEALVAAAQLSYQYIRLVLIYLCNWMWLILSLTGMSHHLDWK
jgi:ATP-dependent Clp protease ATP-binding subunit ClpC